jgi:bifunctional UDP-N-acetylglucosamine pyrophosphorylase / glucosamine-1-phosphate N-acetyltransferase
MSKINDNTSLLILSAGKGTRMIEDKPKVLMTILGKSFIEYVIDSFVKTGVRRIIPIVGFQADKVQSLLGHDYDYAIQSVQLGTGHAVKMARTLLQNQDGITLIIAGDQPFIKPNTIKTLIELHTNESNALTLLSIDKSNPFGYGRILRDHDQVIGMAEETDATEEQKKITEVNLSTYCFDNKLLWKHIDEITNNNKKKEYYINDLVGIFNQHGYKVNAMKSDNYLETIGINDKIVLEEATSLMKLSINEQHMEQGVTIVDKNNTYIGPDVVIGAGTIIYPNSVIEGKVQIGKNCRIESSYIRDSIIGDDVTVGPFAHIRNESIIGDNVRIGNFVEIKKSTLSKGVKSAHLTYLGDSDIGENTNIGCGTITVNYDGKKKNKTVIGKNSFIGSNVNLIAPITIGDNVTIAAGSTINEDVPNDSLAIARERQTTKVGYYNNGTTKK